MRSASRLSLASWLAIFVASAAVACTGDDTRTATPVDAQTLSVAVSDHHDLSPPLRDMVAAPAAVHPHDDEDGDDGRLFFDAARAREPDPIAQRTITAAATTPLVVNVEGLGAGIPSGVYATPPDTVSAVGTTQIVTVVNSSMAVWNKTGTMIWGPKPTNTLWAGFGGQCEVTNDGDAKIRYDVLANRWVMTDFSYFTAPYGVCVAVSTSADATGTWNRYFFQFNSQTDYPTLGVWSDGYYLTINGVLTADNLDVPVCAFDRTAMLAGAQAARQCFSTAARGAVPTPADLAGGAAPPTGEPEMVVAVDRNTGTAVDTWKLHVDWTTPANSALTGPTAVPVAQFTGPQNAVAQPNTTQQLTPGGNAFPFAYRNFGDHEAFVFADVVASGTVDTPRWYELRLSNGNPTLYQQGTFAPADNVFRFMPSINVDKYGNLALGYSVASATVSPGIRFTGRVPTDTLGQMTLAETTIVAGAGAQTGSNRWGDYSSMSIDPSDDCTFWYSQEYIGEVTSVGWRTKLTSFRLPGCSGTTPPPPTPIVNGDFETGALTPWTSTGTTSIATTPHAGTYAALAGKVGTTTKGDSSIAQTFTAPSTGGTLSFWYKVMCLDSVTYDWATATLKDNTAGTTTTPLAKTCNKTGTWVQVSSTLVASHSYTLTLTSHDDGYSNADATYTLFDDVAIGGGTPPPPPTSIVNGDFETGVLTPWTPTGSASIATTPHTGTYAALTGKVGTTTKGDSSIAQSFTASSSGGTLSFWYKVMCLDSVTYDWATATLKDTTTGTTATMLAKTCNKTGTWVQVSSALTASHAYTLTLTNHDDGYSNADATYTLFDDVAVK